MSILEMGKGLGRVLLLVILACWVGGCGQQSPSTESRSNTPRSLVNGTLVPVNEGAKYPGVVHLKIITGWFSNTCTASYLGNGIFLTAYHCLFDSKAQDGEVPVFRVRRYDANTEEPLDLKQYRYSTPVTESLKERTLKKDLPLPDLMIIDGGELAAQYMTGVDPVKLPTLEPIPQQMHMLGFGKNGYRGTTVSGQLHVGAANIIETSELLYTSQWETGATNASGAVGDSGGPLYAIDADGDIVVYGVAHAIRLHKEKGEKDYRSAKTFFTRVDRQKIRDWIAKPEFVSQGP